MRRLHFCLMTVALAAAPTLATPALADRAVAVNTAVIFEAPGLQHRRLGSLSTGEWVNVEYCEGGWCFIKATENRKGWADWKLLAAPGMGWQGGTAVPGATPTPPGPQVFNGTEVNAGAYQPPSNSNDRRFEIKTLPFRLNTQ